jgi:hypothetical protein
MMETSQARRKSTTHFEQVPVEAVKKIAGREASNTEKAGSRNVTVESASRKTAAYPVPAGSIATDLKRASAARRR